VNKLFAGIIVLLAANLIFSVVQENNMLHGETEKTQETEIDLSEIQAAPVSPVRHVHHLTQDIEPILMQVSDELKYNSVAGYDSNPQPDTPNTVGSLSRLETAGTTEDGGRRITGIARILLRSLRSF